MIKNLKLSTKLIIAFLAIGLIPFTVLSIVSVDKASSSLSESSFNQLRSVREIKRVQVENFFSEREGDLGVLVDTVDTLRSEAFKKLEAVREIKRKAIGDYFGLVESQISIFSSDPTIVSAAREFVAAFDEFENDNLLEAASTAQQRTAVKAYYEKDFGQEFMKQNPGLDPQVGIRLSKLGQTALALQFHYIANNSHPLGSKHKLDRANDYSTYSDVHARFHPAVRNFLERFGYYDIFIVEPKSGHIVYSVFKELDFATSLVNGPYADTNIAEVFRKANMAKSSEAIELVDFDLYYPSYQAPAGFIASPIYSGKTKVAIAIFQIPLDKITSVMSQRAGLGETGESYLVGPDHLMRSDSYLDPDNHSVVASFRNPEKGSVKSLAVQEALVGKSGATVIEDYNGNPVLSAYAPLELPGGLVWALLTEIDVAEAFSPKDDSGTYFFQKYTEAYGYYDLFLVNPDGFVFYSVAQESDYQTNLVDGKWSDSNLGQLVRKVLETRSFGAVDFAPYGPSNNEPASFIAQPLVKDGKVELVVALQLSLEALNGIMTQREGMGETGETYLIGSDYLMRSDSFLDPENHTVKASFADPSKGSVRTAAARAAIGGKIGDEIIEDYNGNPVLSAYTPLDIFGMRWGLLAEIDEAEAFAPVWSLERWIFWVALIGIAIILLVSIGITRAIASTLVRIMETISEGAREVTVAASQVSSSSQSLAQGTTEQAASLEETAASLEEIGSMSQQNADNASQAEGITSVVEELSREGGERMAEMEDAVDNIKAASDETADIIRTIDEIAFQTNLLALNAAVEAARAGDAGKGFAVVAEEVRGLAQRSADAAKDTAAKIERASSHADRGVKVTQQVSEALTEIRGNAEKAANLVREISAASQEQSHGLSQLNSAMSQLDQVTQSNAAIGEESAAASEELSAQARMLDDSAEELRAVVYGGNVSRETSKSRGSGELRKNTASSNSSDEPCDNIIEGLSDASEDPRSPHLH